jgi:hypothetical protein
MNAWLMVLALRGAPSEAAGPRRSAPEPLARAFLTGADHPC